MNSAPGIITDQVTCRFCSKQVPRTQLVGTPQRGFACQRCVEWHFHALGVLGGEVPKGCQCCNKPWDALKEESNGVEVRMYAVPKDGIYQLLCAQCKDAYVQKRRDLYGKTEYGADLKL